MLLYFTLHVRIDSFSDGKVRLMNIFLCLGTGFPNLQSGGVGVWGQGVLPAPFTPLR